MLVHAAQQFFITIFGKN